MKTIVVSAGIIQRGGKVFATQRKYGEFQSKWEFPGGKREEGETGRNTIVRELKEELDVIVNPEKHLGRIEYQYPEFKLEMDLYLCSIVEGTPTLKVHDDGKWLDLASIDSLDWLPADLIAVEMLKKEFPV